MILTVDIGTSTMKGALFSSSGKMVGRAFCPMQFFSPDPKKNLWEAPSEQWLSGLSELLSQLQITENLRAIAVTSHGPTLVPVGKGGKPLGTALLWMDRRAEQEAREVQDFLNTSIDASFYFPKILWLKRHRPTLYNRCATFLSPSEFINHHLTGESSLVVPAALYESWFWNPELATHFGIDMEKLPALVKPGDVVGQLRTEKKASLGLKGDPLVVAVGPDFVASILGVGAVHPGQLCSRAGTSDGVNLCVKRRVSDFRFRCLGHPVEGLYNLSATIDSTGSYAEWVKRLLWRNSSSYESFFREVESLSPFEETPVLRPHKKAFCRKGFSYIPGLALERLSLRHGRAHIAWAVLEFLGYSVRKLLEMMEETGASVEEIRLVGRLVQWPFFNQFRANTTGRAVWVPSFPEAELVGSLSAALCGLGEYHTFSEASESVVRCAYCLEPQSEYRAYHDERYALFRENWDPSTKARDLE